MQIWPAIDLRGGKCVRLRQGDYQQETVFSDCPQEMARHWVEQGAQRLHIVDLDGARDGHLVNDSAISTIVQAVAVPCELGGGIRDQETIEHLLDLGLARLVVGTRAVTHPDWFADMTERFPDRLVAGIDARDGLVATDGWLETSTIRAIDLASQLAFLPIAAIVYTDIARDGMMQGPNIEAMAAMAQHVSAPVIASGGVSSIDDVARLTRTRVSGCIIGRALYEGSLDLREALAVAGDVNKGTTS